MVRWDVRGLNKLTEMTTSPSLNLGAMVECDRKIQVRAYAKSIVYKKREGVVKEGRVG
jgi:hypothetical protein